MNHGDLIWGILPQAMDGAAASVAAYERHMQAQGLTAGPAVDAERNGLPIEVSNGVALVSLVGTMVRRAGPYASFFGLTGTQNVKNAIASALIDDDVTHIVLRIDSPGGSVAGLDEIGDLINAATKPVIAQVEGMAASAAYYVASQADRILVARNDLVGSIGIRMMLYDYSKMFDQQGIKAIPIDTGEFKSAGAIGTVITEAQQADFQRITDFYFADFVAVVARGRGITAEQVREVGDGRMFTPGEALASGLIDGISTLQETLNNLRHIGQSASIARAKSRI